MNADIHILTGAYACDALDPDELAAFEEHLAHCDACTQEVLELRATAAALALAEAMEPPAGLHERVLEQIAVTRQQPPVVTSLAEARERRTERTERAERAERASRRWIRPAGWLAGAALLVGVVALGGVIRQQRTEIDSLHGQANAVTRLLAAGDARTVSGSVSTGGTATVVVSTTDNGLIFTAAGLPALPAGKAYQIWLIDAAGVRPGPVLRPVDGAVSPVITGNLDGAQTIAMTVEPSAGSTQPTTTPVLTLTTGA
jgi:hypothetical protein